jgi:hypothetical protein
MNEEEEANQIDIGNLPDFGTGINVITITYNNNDDSLPHMDLGDCSPWVAITLLKSAMETLEIMIPPIGVTYKGDVVIAHSIDLDEEDGEELE